MYDEGTFKRHIIWLKVRRIIIVALFAILGCLVGFISSEMIVDTLDFDAKLRNIIFIVTTISGFLFGILCTEGSAIAIQDGYWKMAVLRKLTLISIKLDKSSTPLPPEELEQNKKDEKSKKSLNEENVESVKEETISKTDSPESEEVEIVN